MAARQRVWFLTSISVILCVLLLPAAAKAAERLQNGDFEQGNSGWSGVGFSSNGDCLPRNGDRAATLTGGNGPARVQQTVNNIADGEYTLSGYARVHSGSSSLTLSFVWYDAGGRAYSSDRVVNPSSSGYSSFSFSGESPAQARSLVVHLRAASASAVVCLDDLELDGPAQATATPRPTSTQPPTSTPTLTPTATSPPSVAATNTPSAAASTATPQPTAFTVPNSLSFVNGGFESGLDGWQKYGGELDDVSSPRRSGSRAASLTSTTTSTKWAYQVVAVSPSSAYEFAGYLQPGSGITEAYLRVSWYSSADGSGTALATDDSTTRISGGASSFAYLTIGARTPPPGARSARVRVMLTPAGTAAATLYFDDVSFGVASVPPGAAPPPSTSAAVDEVVEAPAQPAAVATAATRTPAPSASTPSPTPLAQVASSVQEGTPLPREAPALEQPRSLPEDGGGFDALSALGLALGSVLAVAGFGGAVFYQRWRR